MTHCVFARSRIGEVQWELVDLEAQVVVVLDTPDGGPPFAQPNHVPDGVALEYARNCPPFVRAEKFDVNGLSFLRLEIPVAESPATQ